MSGVFNAVGNNPVTNIELVAAIKQAKGARAFVIPAPAFVLKMALGEMSQMVLGSQRCRNEKLLRTGFQFRFQSLKEALQNLYF